MSEKSEKYKAALARANEYHFGFSITEDGFIKSNFRSEEDAKEVMIIDASELCHKHGEMKRLGLIYRYKPHLPNIDFVEAIHDGARAQGLSGDDFYFDGVPEFPTYEEINNELNDKMLEILAEQDLLRFDHGGFVLFKRCAINYDSEGYAKISMLLPPEAGERERDEKQ